MGDSAPEFTITIFDAKTACLAFFLSVESCRSSTVRGYRIASFKSERTNILRAIYLCELQKPDFVAN